MRFSRKHKPLIEPPAAATGDIAFNLIVFFLVCASVQPDTGRRQDIPRSEPQKKKQEQSKNVEVALTRSTVAVNGNPVPLPKLGEFLTKLLAERKRPADRIVVVKSAKDATYDHWVKITSVIESAGGVVTLQMEEERTVVAD